MSAGAADGPGCWLHVRVEGRVQGVGYRWYVSETATQLGVAGWVRNLPDGSVEVSAVGGDEALATLRQRLSSGPRHARAERLDDLGGGERPAGATFEIAR